MPKKSKNKTRKIKKMQGGHLMLFEQYNKIPNTYSNEYKEAAGRQQVKYGKTKAGKPIYQIHPLKKILPPFWITYGGNLTGRLIIEFKFKEWPNDSKLPFAETVSIIGILDDSILIKTLLKHYQVDRKDFSNKLEINHFEKSIERKNLKDLTIFSIGSLSASICFAISILPSILPSALPFSSALSISF